MKIFYYRNNVGQYVGAFDTPQDGLIECEAPLDARQSWDNDAGKWCTLLPEPLMKVVYAADLWKRVTDDEADQIEAAMSSQPARVRNAFRSANSYTSDDELWPLLVTKTEALFGESRSAEILAPSF